MKKLNNTNGDSSVHNLISQGTTIKGDIETSGDLRIDGNIIGNIITKGKLVVGESAHIEGTIECENADISGKITAKVKINNLVRLSETSKFSGDIVTKKISIEPGAIFSGNCQMTSNIAGNNNEKLIAGEKK
ncbi:MAG: cell shape determination protein CcmA [Marinilabiliales bacterium]|nr:MAG: cell shape determination protein CcmA [Marinilabiliales bacterium]